MKIYKKAHNFYSVVNAQGREVAVFNYYRSAMRYIRNHKGGCR